MDPVELWHVSVWIDSAAACGAAFLEALDWASSLNVPLKVLVPSKGMAEAPLHGAFASQLEECVATGTRRGVPCDALECGHWSAVREHLFGPHGLSVFSTTLSARVKTGLLRWSLRARENAVLVCPGASHSVSRVLIVHAPHELDKGFLGSALSLCRSFGASPVILTVARTEKEARQGQQAAEQACHGHRLAAHLDYVAGVDKRVAVASIARWRRCSHVFLERRQAIPWWRWLRGDTLEGLLGLTDSLTYLALPEAGLQARATYPTRDRLAAY
jgi:hypothetical protein